MGRGEHGLWLSGSFPVAVVEASLADAQLWEFLEGKFFVSPFLLTRTFVLHTKQVSSALPSPPNRNSLSLYFTSLCHPIFTLGSTFQEEQVRNPLPVQ